MSILPLKHSSKLFYRFDLNISDKFGHELYGPARHVNGSWEDIEYLNYVFHSLFSRLNNDTGNDEFNIIFDSVLVVSKDFYIHLEIIRVLFRDKIEPLMDKPFKDIIAKYDEVWNRIRDARNLTIIHKEKPNFYEERGSYIGTDPAVLLTMDMTYFDKNSVEVKVTLQPLRDIKIIHDFLNEFQQLFNKTYSKGT